MAKQLEIENIVIDIEKKAIKTMRLVVSAEKIRVAAPMKTSLEDIMAFVTSKIAWIKKHQAKFILRAKIVENAKEMLAPMSELYYFQGVAYILRVIKSDEPPEITLSTENINNETKKYLNLRTPAHLDEVTHPILINTWYRTQLEKNAKPLIEKWEAVIGVKCSEFRIKRMKTRWGTCNIRDKRIWLSLDLAKKPLSCLEYIIVHELVHLLERLHNARFVGFMDKFLPDWKQRQKELNEF